MVQRLKEVDVVIIGVGMVGSIVAKELAAAGYKVVGLERGQPRFTVPDFQGPAVHDELRFDVRKALMQDNTREAVTFRNHGGETALPVRRWESFLPGTGLGGSHVGHPVGAGAAKRATRTCSAPARELGHLSWRWRFWNAR